MALSTTANLYVMVSIVLLFAAVGLAFILGSILGGGIKHGLESVYGLDSILQFGNISLMYVVSTLLIVLIQLFFTFKHEKKNKEYGGNIVL